MVIKMFSKLLALVLSAFMAAPAEAVYSGEYKGAMDFVTSKGIMNGDENGDLMPDKTITRAEMAKMITEVCGKDIDDTQEGMSFTDVPSTHWAAGYIQKAYSAGIINGFPDGSFKPEETVTKAQTLKLMLAACGANSYRYPYGYISKAVEDGILDGIELEPDDAITREETAQIIYNICNAVNSGMLSIADDADKSYDDKAGTQSYGYGLFKTTEQKTDTERYPLRAGSAAAVSGGMMSSSSAPMLSESSSSSGGGGGGSLGYDSAYSMETAVHPNNRYPYGTGEEYTANEPNIFKKTSLSPLSTFSIDTDTASYSNIRRFILNGSVPAKDSVRTEEIINYFSYSTPEAADGEDFGVYAETTECPWSENKLARITVTGGDVKSDMHSNLVFLIDVSGSMISYNKLPMLKKAVCMMVDELDGDDTISVVTYASGTDVVLEPTKGDKKDEIKKAVNDLCAGGGTNGADGLALAYEQIEKNLCSGNNRIILCSDGDFNIGPSSVSELKELVEEKRRAGIYLTTAGFGMGNYKDNRMELLADCGNGSYYYIDTMREAKRVFCDNIRNTLYTVAEDVKLQVEFNPAVVSQYRLIGYENRALEDEQFNDDTVDAGELGAGSTVTVLYELILGEDNARDTGESSEYRYQKAEYTGSSEVFDVKIRYKKPGSTESILKEYPVENIISEADSDTAFASAAAMLGLKLNGVIDTDYKAIIDTARKCVTGENGEYTDKSSERSEFVQLVEILKYIDFEK